MIAYDSELSNHIPTEANITMGSLLGKHRPRIKPPQTRRLNSKIEIKIKRIHHSYIDRLEKHFKKYHILVQLEVLEKDAGFPASEEGTRALEGLDKQVTLFMLNAERKYRKIYVGEYEVSPQVKTRIDRYRALRQLIWERQRKCRNTDNVSSFTKRCSIKDSMSYSGRELAVQYREYKKRSKTLMVELL